LLLAHSPHVLAVTLKVATLAPEGSGWMKEMREAAGEIQRKTEGRVKMKFYPGGVMGNERNVLRKIRIRQLQGGAFTGGGLADVYPNVQIYSLPFLFNSYDEVEYVREHVDRLVRDGLEKNGLVALGIVGGGFAYLMCNTAMYSVADLKGQKIWIPEGDRISEAILEAADVTAVPLPLADVYTGLQTGLVDTIASSSMAAIAFQWHTRVTDLIDVPLIYLVGILAVDKRAFDKLSSADQTVVRDIIARHSRRLDALDRINNEQARDALKQQGVSFHRPPRDELARWRKIADDATAILGNRGVYTPGMLRTVQERLDDYRKQSRSIDGD